ncbi:amidohydrolase [Geothrix limicola]|uniref:Amidohydrolase n=1 Tax=Geothrix limicola TaxID=2927978 RepID=A0ABQ5QDW1_9BACT|nr:amidohydrolase family protein [Geothrix limicola]GLH72848.1 amidohydrolase [Geothrix limicola]
MNRRLPALAQALSLSISMSMAFLPLQAQDKPQAFIGAHIIPIEGPDIERGVLVVQGGKILAVGGPGTAIPEGAVRHDAAGKVIMPGLIDTHSHIGSPEGADSTAPIQPEVRVSDSLNLRSASVMKARAGGITSVNVMPGSGHLLSGQTMYLKLREGQTVDALAMEKRPDGSYLGGMKMANGTNSRHATGPFPGTRAKSAALVREQFLKAQDYQRKLKEAGDDPKKRPARDLGMEALVEVLEGKRVVHHHTHRHDDILTVLRLQKEFGFKVVLHHVSDAWMVADEIAKSGMGASIITIDSPGGKLETKDARMTNGAALEKAGVLVGFHTDDPITDSRWFIRSGALAVRAGMSRKGALEGLTLSGAKLLDLQNRIGSLKPGKDADFLVLSADPLSIYAHVEETWVEGAKVFDRADPKQRLYAVGGPGASHDTDDLSHLLALEAEETYQ